MNIFNYRDLISSTIINDFNSIDNKLGQYFYKFGKYIVVSLFGVFDNQGALLLYYDSLEQSIPFVYDYSIQQWININQGLLILPTSITSFSQIKVFLNGYLLIVKKDNQYYFYQLPVYSVQNLFSKILLEQKENIILSEQSRAQENWSYLPLTQTIIPQGDLNFREFSSLFTSNQVLFNTLPSIVFNNQIQIFKTISPFDSDHFNSFVNLQSIIINSISHVNSIQDKHNLIGQSLNTNQYIIASALFTQKNSNTLNINLDNNDITIQSSINPIINYNADLNITINDFNIIANNPITIYFNDKTLEFDNKYIWNINNQKFINQTPFIFKKNQYNAILSSVIWTSSIGNTTHQFNTNLISSVFTNNILSVNSLKTNQLINNKLNIGQGNITSSQMNINIQGNIQFNIPILNQELIFNDSSQLPWNDKSLEINNKIVTGNINNSFSQLYNSDTNVFHIDSIQNSITISSVIYIGSTIIQEDNQLLSDFQRRDISWNKIVYNPFTQRFLQVIKYDDYFQLESLVPGSAFAEFPCHEERCSLEEYTNNFKILNVFQYNLNEYYYQVFLTDYRTIVLVLFGKNQIGKVNQVYLIQSDPYNKQWKIYYKLNNQWNTTLIWNTNLEGFSTSDVIDNPTTFTLYTLNKATEQINNTKAFSFENNQIKRFYVSFPTNDLAGQESTGLVFECILNNNGSFSSKNIITTPLIVNKTIGLDMEIDPTGTYIIWYQLATTQSGYVIYTINTNTSLIISIPRTKILINDSNLLIGNNNQTRIYTFTGTLSNILNIPIHTIFNTDNQFYYIQNQTIKRLNDEIISTIKIKYYQNDTNQLNITNDTRMQWFNTNKWIGFIDVPDSDFQKERKYFQPITTYTTRSQFYLSQLKEKTVNIISSEFNINSQLNKNVFLDHYGLYEKNYHSIDYNTIGQYYYDNFNKNQWTASVNSRQAMCLFGTDVALQIKNNNVSFIISSNINNTIYISSTLVFFNRPENISPTQRSSIYGDVYHKGIITLSNKDLKKNIQEVSNEEYIKLNMYSWNYIWSKEKKIGLLAEEVYPHSQINVINYEQLGNQLLSQKEHRSH